MNIDFTIVISTFLAIALFFIVIGIFNVIASLFGAGIDYARRYGIGAVLLKIVGILLFVSAVLGAYFLYHKSADFIQGIRFFNIASL